MASSKDKPDDLKKKKEEADVKKKTTTKKGTVKKTVGKKSVASKKINVKKASVKTPKQEGKKISKAKVDNADQIVKKSDDKKKSGLKDFEKKERFVQNVMIGIGAVIVVILLAYLAYVSVNTSEEIPVVELNSSVDLLVVENPSCVECQVDAFVKNLQDKGLINSSERVDYNSEFGREVVEFLDAKQIPIYLFSQSVKQTKVWKDQPEIAKAFSEEIINNKTYLVLNPVAIPLQAKELLSFTDVEGSAYVGNKDAKVVIYELSDYKCPYCGIVSGKSSQLDAFKQQVPDFEAPVPAIYEKYVKEGLVKKVFYNIPFHGEASYVSGEASICAFEQGEYKKMYDKLFEEQGNWNDNISVKMAEYAEQIGLDVEKFNVCMSEGRKSVIEAEALAGNDIGISGTPTFVITNGESYKVLVGAQSYSEFEPIIESMLE